MRITYDPQKREATRQDRGLDFADAEKVFGGRHFTTADARHDYGDYRFQTVGYLDSRMVMVVWTPRGDDTHIMSMRKCNAREQKAYRQRLEAG